MKQNERNVKAMMAVLLFGGFLSLFNENILNVALPKLMLEMQITANTVQWLSTGYMLVVAVMVPTSAFFIHTFTTRQLYLGAMAIFTLGLILAAVSPSFPMLLAARMIQAVGTGLLAPIMINTALAINPYEKYGMVIGVCTCVIMVGPAMGPIVSGAMLHFFNWPSLFIILIPMALLCMIGGSVYLENVLEITKPKIDYLSIALSTIGFSLIVYGMSIIGSNSTVPTSILLLAAGALILGFFCKRQLSLKQPMLDIRAFIKPYFTLGAILVIVIQMVQFSLNVVLPLLLENGMELSSFMSAMVLFPAVFVCSIMTIVSGSIYDKVGGKSLIPLGMLLMCIFLAVMWQIGPSTSLIGIAAITTCIYFGISLAWVPNQSNALKELSMEAQADGVAIINTFIQLGAAMGTSLFVGLMTAGQNRYLESAGLPHTPEAHVQAIFSGFNHSMAVAAVIIAISFILSLSLRRQGKTRAVAPGCAEKPV